jgi:hypothetical protein
LLARGAERAPPTARRAAGALLRAAAAPRRHLEHASRPATGAAAGAARGVRRGVARGSDGGGAGEPGAAVGHGQRGEPGAGAGARVLQHAEGHQEDRRPQQRWWQPVTRQRGRVEDAGGGVEGAARVQVQHAGVRLARAQRRRVQGVADGDEPVGGASRAERRVESHMCRVRFIRRSVQTKVSSFVSRKHSDVVITGERSPLSTLVPSESILHKSCLTVSPRQDKANMDPKISDFFSNTSTYLVLPPLRAL